LINGMKLKLSKAWMRRRNVERLTSKLNFNEQLHIESNVYVMVTGSGWRRVKHWIGQSQTEHV